MNINLKMLKFDFLPPDCKIVLNSASNNFKCMSSLSNPYGIQLKLTDEQNIDKPNRWFKSIQKMALFDPAMG